MKSPSGPFSVWRRTIAWGALVGIGIVIGWKLPRRLPEGAEFRPVILKTITSAGERNTDATAAAIAGKLLAEGPQPRNLDGLLAALHSQSSVKARGLIAAQVATMDAAQLKAWLVELRSRPYGDPLQEELRSMLYERWAEVDMAGLMASIGNHRNRYGNDANYWVSMQAAFGTLARRNPQAAWEQAQKLGDEGYAARRAVINALASSQPAAALELIKGAKGRDSQWMADSLFGTWAARDPLEAAAAVAGLTDVRLKERAVDGLARSWTQRDFDGAYAWASGLEKTGDRQKALATVLSTLASDDPQKALGALEASNIGARRHDVMSQIMSAWANTDFDAALSFATSRDKFADQRDALQGVVQSVRNDESRGERLLSLAKTLPAPLARDVYQSGVWAFAYDQPERLKAWVGQIQQPSIREDVLSNSVNYLSQMNGDAAAELFDLLQPTSQRPNDAQQTARQWAETDPAKAVAWASGLTNVELQKAALSSAVASWTSSDPKAAAAYAATLPAGETRDGALRSLAEVWVRNDPAGAQAWAAGLSGAERTAVLGSLVSQAQQSDPAAGPAAYREFAASLSPADAEKPENQQVARNLARSMAQDDPQKAIAWLPSLGEGARDEATGGIASAWVAYDPVAASEWIGQLAPGKGRDLAAESLAGAIARDDPDSAFVWATSIGDVAARRKATEGVLATWKNNGGREAAGRALAGATFTDDERHELEEKLK